MVKSSGIGMGREWAARSGSRTSPILGVVLVLASFYSPPAGAGPETTVELPGSYDGASDAGLAAEATIQKKSSVFFKDLDQSIRPLALEITTGPDSNVNALIGIAGNGHLYRSASPGDSVFVGSAASPERSPALRAGSDATIPPSGAEAVKDHGTFSPGASVFRAIRSIGAADGGLMLKNRAFIALSDQSVFSRGIESFGIGDTALMLPIAVIGVFGALDSSLATLVGTAPDSNNFEP